jgi:hypothetical protein
VRVGKTQAIFVFFSLGFFGSFMNDILAEGAIALSVTLSGGALFASWKLLQFLSSLIVKVILAIFMWASAQLSFPTFPGNLCLFLFFTNMHWLINRFQEQLKSWHKSITVFTSSRTNLSPFTKGCRERDTSMWISQFLRGIEAPTQPCNYRMSQIQCSLCEQPVLVGIVKVEDFHLPLQKSSSDETGDGANVREDQPQKHWQQFEHFSAAPPQCYPDKSSYWHSEFCEIFTKGFIYPLREPKTADHKTEPSCERKAEQTRIGHSTLDGVQVQAGRLYGNNRA